MHITPGAASLATTAGASVAPDTKRSWKGMVVAAGGCGGWGATAEFRGGRTKDYPLQATITPAGWARGMLLPHSDP